MLLPLAPPGDNDDADEDERCVEAGEGGKDGIGGRGLEFDLNDWPTLLAVWVVADK